MTETTVLRSDEISDWVAVLKTVAAIRRITILTVEITRTIQRMIFTILRMFSTSPTVVEVTMSGASAPVLEVSCPSGSISKPQFAIR